MRHIGVVARVLDDPRAGPAIALLGEDEREDRGLAARQADRDGIREFAGQQRLERGAGSGGGTGPRRPAPPKRRRVLPCHATILAKPRPLATVGHGSLYS